MQGKVDICGISTSQLRVLSQEETDSLLRRSRQGDEGARQMLIEGNLRLVLSVIQRFDKRGESPDDLFQVGCIGLMKAIDNINHRFGVKSVRLAAEGDSKSAWQVKCDHRSQNYLTDLKELLTIHI